MQATTSVGKKPVPSRYRTQAKAASQSMHLSFAWKQQVVMLLPWVFIGVTLVHIVATLRFFDPTMYHTSSIELIPVKVSTSLERFFVANTFIVIALQLVSVPGLIWRKSFSWWMAIVATLITFLNNILFLSIPGIVFSFFWVYILLHIRKEYS